MNGFYRAKVLDNDDPDQLGRIKVEVYPILIGEVTARTLTDVEGIATSVLPWAVPAFPLFDGAGTGFGGFSVPKVDSFVFVFFESGNIYQPVYFAEAPDAVHGMPTERITNYPNRKVLKTQNEIVIIIDDTDDEEVIRVEHPTGSYVEIDGTGNISISSVADITIAATGDVNITSGGEVNING